MLARRRRGVGVEAGGDDLAVQGAVEVFVVREREVDASVPGVVGPQREVSASGGVLDVPVEVRGGGGIGLRGLRGLRREHAHSEWREPSEDFTRVDADALRRRRRLAAGAGCGRELAGCELEVKVGVGAFGVARPSHQSDRLPGEYGVAGLAQDDTTVAVQVPERLFRSANETRRLHDDDAAVASDVVGSYLNNVPVQDAENW